MTDLLMGIGLAAVAVSINVATGLSMAAHRASTGGIVFAEAGIVLVWLCLLALWAGTEGGK